MTSDLLVDGQVPGTPLLGYPTTPVPPTITVAPTAPAESGQPRVEPTDPGEAPLLTTGDDPAFAGGMSGALRPIAGSLAPHWALLNLLLTIGAVLLTALAAILGVKYRLYHRREVEIEPITYEKYLASNYRQSVLQGEAAQVAESQEARRREAIRALALAALSALAIVVLWVVTQRIVGYWVWTDNWTLLFAALFAVTLLVYLRHRHTAKDLADLDDQQADLTQAGAQ